MKKSKLIINIAVIAIISIAILIYMLLVDGIDNILLVIKRINITWILVAFSLIIIYWLLEAFILYIIGKKTYPKIRFFNSLRTTMIGQLFNNLTPFSSGGQPMQAASMIKGGVPATTTATILLIKFIVYQFTLVIYTGIIMVFKHSYFKEIVSSFTTLATIGFIVNLCVIIFLIAIGINKKFIITICKIGLKLLEKIRLIKDYNEKVEKLTSKMDIFHSEFKIIQKEKITIFKASILSALQLTAFFAITYAVYRSFGNNSSSLINIISAQAFLSMVMAFMPTPGAGGAAEGGFFIIFKTLFKENEMSMAILCWRFFSFYLPIIVGTLFMLIKRQKNKIESEEIIKDNL